MSRAETAARLVDLVLNGCGVSSFQDFAAIVNDEDGAVSFLNMCRAAAAQPPVVTVNAPATPAVIEAPHAHQQRGLGARVRRTRSIEWSVLGRSEIEFSDSGGPALQTGWVGENKKQKTQGAQGDETQGRPSSVTHRTQNTVRMSNPVEVIEDRKSKVQVVCKW